MLGETKYLSRDSITWSSTKLPDCTSESSSGKISPLPTFVDIARESRQALSGSARSSSSMESSNPLPNDRESNQDHIGLSQIAAFEPVDQTGKPEEDAGDQSSHVWTLQEVESLLKLYKDREVDLKDPRRKKKTIWNEICTEMRLLGFAVSPGQCECKMKNMKATYRRTLDRIRAGDNVPRCAFYEELYEIFGLSPNIRTFPTSATQETPNSRKRNHALNDINSKDGDESLEDEQTETVGLGLKRSRSDYGMMGYSLQDSVSQEHDLRQKNAEFIEELRLLRKSLEQERHAREEERKKNEEERDRRAREFHEERMAMLNSMNNLIASLGNKD